MNDRQSPNGTAILVLGILGFFICPLGIVAWVWGHSEAKKFPDDSNVKTGKLLGMIMTLFNVIVTALVVLVFGGVMFFAVDQMETIEIPEEFQTEKSVIEQERI